MSGGGTGVSVLVGNGDGRFSTPVFYPTGRSCYQVVVADFNGDGLADVIVETGFPAGSSQNYGSFAILTGTAEGSLRLVPYQNGYTSNGRFVIGDYNGDGRPDVVQSVGADLFLWMAQAPHDFSIGIERRGNFQQGQQGAAYTISVRNEAATATTDTAIVSVKLPDGMAFVSMEGAGWFCGNTCAKSDSLPAGASYPVITLKINISARAATPAMTAVSVATMGWSDVNPGNDTAIDNGLILQNQRIIFGTLPDVILGSTPFAVAAKATSGLDVTTRHRETAR